MTEALVYFELVEPETVTVRRCAKLTESDAQNVDTWLRENGYATLNEFVHRAMTGRN